MDYATPTQAQPSRPEFSTFTLNSTEYSVDYRRAQAPVATYLRDGRAYLPQRALAEALGVEVRWDAAAGAATFADPATGSIVVLTKGSATYCLNGVELTMDAPPRLVEGSLTCPARYLAEAFGYQVNLNRPNHLVIIYR